MTEVSVLTTVYNGMPYFAPAVESILNQTLQDFRFVIVNDGSTDGTTDYLNSLDDQRIHVIHQENGGTARAANHGLEYIDTPFVARMDADDIALPHRLETQVEFLKANPNVGLVGAQIVPMGEYGEGKSLNLPQGHERIMKCLMERSHGLAHNVIMMRTNVLKSIGGYWKHRLIDDWDMMIRMGEVSGLENINEVLLKYRIHGGSLNGSSQARMHRHYGYAVKLAELRRDAKPEISFEEYVAEQDARPWMTRKMEQIHIHAIAQYRIGLADLYGKKPMRGYGRIAWAALCSPGRTLHRIGRILRRG